MAKSHPVNPDFESRHQIAQEYQICVKTLIRKLDELEMELPDDFLSLLQQKKIYEALG
jgi:hypothetical protein